MLFKSIGRQNGKRMRAVRSDQEEIIACAVNREEKGIEDIRSNYRVSAAQSDARGR